MSLKKAYGQPGGQRRLKGRPFTPEPKPRNPRATCEEIAHSAWEHLQTLAPAEKPEVLEMVHDLLDGKEARGVHAPLIEGIVDGYSKRFHVFCGHRKR